MPDEHGKSHGGSTTNMDPTTTTLVSISQEISRVSAELDSVLRSWVEPPEPDKPTAVNATNTILSQAAHITSAANSIMAKLRAG